MSNSTITWARMFKVSQHILCCIERDLKEKQFPILSWHDVLSELHHAEGKGLRPFQLQEAMLLAQYNLSRLIDRMEAAGLVYREPLPEDGRGHRIHITPKGEEVLHNMQPAYQTAVNKHFSSRLDDQEIQALSDIFAKLRG